VPKIKNIAKSCAVFIFGRERRPRRILRGLPSGYTIKVSPAENLSYLVGTAELHLQRAIRRYVTDGDTVYDIGANVGYVSLSLAKQVGSSGYVAAFEPVPQNIEVLRENIRNNELTNVQVFDVAASEKQGQAIIRFAGNLAMASLVWHKGNALSTEVVVKTVALDDLVEAGDLPGRPKFVKIDVEGAEGLTLVGMKRTLAAAKPVVFIECSETGRETAWQLLRQLEYRCQSAISGREVDSLDQYRHSDFLWLPAK
jgi:FkbM family methyltransferase